MPSSLILPLLLFVGLFIIKECRELLKRREFKELAAASLLLILVLSYGVDYAFNLQLLPNPNHLLVILKPISTTFDKFFMVKG